MSQPAPSVQADPMRAALEACRDFIVAAAQEDQHYGFFLGGDPRLFTPDGENEPHEHAAHKAACEAWDRGDKVPDPKPSGRIEVVTLPEMPDGKGGTIPERTGPAICCGGSYGPGTQTLVDDEAVALLAQIDAALESP